VMAFLQRHLKRLLAYTVISHVGATLCGVALLDAKGLAAAANLVLSHGFLKAALFLATGVLLRAFRSVDELRLHGRGRSLPVLGTGFALCAFGLIGFPYVGSFLGHSLLDDAARAAGHTWITPLLMIAGGISAGAILRAAARVFLGWGPKRDPLLTPEPPEELPQEQANHFNMVTITVLLVAVGLALSVVPGLEDRTDQGASRFGDRHAYVERTLFGAERTYPSPPVTVREGTAESVGLGLGTAAIALLTAGFGLWRQRLPELVRGLGNRALEPAIHGLKAVHSGVPGDYVMWLTLGTAVLGGIWTLTLR
jgi:multicomponent Na+:H+ antiporter subunit D